jgi:pimeloyl-ACP methyl ester carboxylesterase
VAPDTYAPSAPSAWVDLDGPVHYVNYGGPDGAPLVVLVHGLGGSHANWEPLAPLLTIDCRVLAVDLPGFGLTQGAPRPATVVANRRLLSRFLAAVSDGPVVLVGNSMGALISALQAAQEPATVSALALLDPALPVGLSVPDPLVVSTIGASAVPVRVRRAFSRWRPLPTLEELTMHSLRLCTGDPSSVSRSVIDQHIALARRRRTIPGANADLIVAARSLAPFLTQRRRYAAMLRSLRMPVLMIHGDKDRLVPIRAARAVAAANPAWRFEVAAGVGHVPMLEAPEWTAGVLRSWLPTALRPVGTPSLP